MDQRGFHVQGDGKNSFTIYTSLTILLWCQICGRLKGRGVKLEWGTSEMHTNFSFSYMKNHLLKLPNGSSTCKIKRDPKQADATLLFYNVGIYLYNLINKIYFLLSQQCCNEVKV